MSFKLAHRQRQTRWQEGAAALAQLAQQAAQAQEVLTLVHLPRLDAASKKTAWFTALDAHGIRHPHPAD